MTINFSNTDIQLTTSAVAILTAPSSGSLTITRATISNTERLRTINYL